jgi:hypothetical protein
MAAGVVSGIAALLMEARPSLSTTGAKAVLQLTSTFMPAVGLLGAGTGAINALSAVQFVDTAEISTARIAGEDVTATGILTASFSRSRFAGNREAISRQNSVSVSHILWGTSAGDHFLSGTSAGDHILSGTSAGDHILWGTSTGDHILWGMATGDHILWGTFTDDQTLGGTSTGDHFLGGTTDDDY